MTIRGYRAADLAAVVSVFQRSVREVASRDYSPEQVAAWTPEQTDLSVWSARLENGGVFVSEFQDEIVGFARVDDSGYFDLLYVHPGFQGRGIGRELFQQVVAWASSRGVRRLISDVSITARPFFARMGFRVVQPQVVERQGVRLQNFRMELDVEPRLAADARHKTRR
ncbi:MAG TPA: GNAT family N-acetyltransferase [Candidatus Binatia bacterium]|jgi:putative acetyltransferase